MECWGELGALSFDVVVGGNYSWVHSGVLRLVCSYFEIDYYFETKLILRIEEVLYLLTIDNKTRF